MGSVRQHERVKLICSALARSDEHFERAEAAMQEEFGPVDLTSRTWVFDYTDYYENEMGTELKRRIYSFHELIDPAELPGIKLTANEMEQRVTEAVGVTSGRAVNLDPGYISHSKLVLASTKDHAHRIYLGKGIFGEITLQWRRRCFEPVETTYPDYRTEDYRFFFALVRNIYVGQVELEESL